MTRIITALLKRALATVATTVALAAAVAGLHAVPAGADTNTSTSKSTQLLCNVVLLSPGARVDGCRNEQITKQVMTKTNTSNNALVDYAKVELGSLLP